MKNIQQAVFLLAILAQVIPLQASDAENFQFLFKINVFADEPTQPARVDRSKLSGIAINSFDKIFVVDRHNHQIKVFEANGEFVQSFGSRGAGENQFDLPCGIAIGADDTLYVADFGNHRVQALTYDNLTNKITHKLSIRLDSATTDHVISPRNIAVDVNNRIYVIDLEDSEMPGRILVFDADGKINKLRRPFEFRSTNIAVAADGTIILTETGEGEATYVVPPYGQPTPKFEKEPMRDDPDGMFLGQEGVAIDIDGSVYIAYSICCRVQKFGVNGTFLQDIKLMSDENPKDLAINSQGTVFVTTAENTIQAFQLR